MHVSCFLFCGAEIPIQAAFIHALAAARAAEVELHHIVQTRLGSKN